MTSQKKKIIRRINEILLKIHINVSVSLLPTLNNVQSHCVFKTLKYSIFKME